MDESIQNHRTRLSSTGGWGQLEYTGWIDESLSWKSSCYVGDWSFLDELQVTGPDALRFFSDFAVNSLASFALGQAKHLICCNTDGKVIGEGVLMRLAEDSFEFQALGPVMTWLEYNLAKGGYRAEARYSNSKFKYQVSGPRSLFLLEELSRSDLRDIKFMHVRTLDLAGAPVAFLRQGMAGEVGFELQGPREAARSVMKALLDVGANYGIRRLGARTAMVNHLEACFPTVTHDYIPAVCEPAEQGYLAYQRKREANARARMWTLDGCLKVSGSFEADAISAWYRSPVELGWSRSIKFDHDFYGRAALEGEMAAPRRGIVTLEWNAEDCMDVQNSLFRPDEEPYDFMDMPRRQFFAMNAQSVFRDGQRVGVATSRGFSYSFRRMLSHCVIDLAHKEPGTPVEVLWGDPGTRQKRIRATVAPSPYKKDNRKIDIRELRDAMALA